MGCAFRLRRIREAASRFRTIFRVALSAIHPIRKMRPTIRSKTGSRFPKHSMQRWHKECPQLPAEKERPYLPPSTRLAIQAWG